MKKIIVLFSTLLIFIIFQDSFFMEFFGNAANPNLILSLIFAFLVLNMDDAALLSAIIGGFLTDLFGVGVIGQHTVLLVLLALILKAFRTYISKNTALTAFLLVISTCIFKQALSFNVFYGALLNVFLMFSFIIFITKISKKFLSTTYRIRA